MDSMKKIIGTSLVGLTAILGSGAAYVRGMSSSDIPEAMENESVACKRDSDKVDDVREDWYMGLRVQDPESISNIYNSESLVAPYLAEIDGDGSGGLDRDRDGTTGMTDRGDKDGIFGSKNLIGGYLNA